MTDELADKGSRKKDLWDKLHTVSGLLGTVAIPVVALLLGHWFTQSLKQGEAKARLVELAVDILKTDPKNTNSVPGLRDWATRLPLRS